jgi:hypothetical protein
LTSAGQDAPKPELDLRPPGRQQALGWFFIASVAVIGVLMASSPPFVILVGALVIPPIVCSGMLLLLPRLTVGGHVIALRTRWGSRATVPISEVANLEVEQTPAPLALRFAIGWPGGQSMSTSVCVLHLHDGRHVPVDALRSMRVPVIGYRLTQTPDDVRARTSELAAEIGHD